MTDLRKDENVINRPDSVAIGSKFDDKFEIIALLGTGANGIVYQAKHLALEEEVALKILRREFIFDQVSMARFKREAQIASQLRHPNLVSVRSFGVTSDGQPYLLMDLLDGLSLSAQLEKSKTLDLVSFRKIFLQILDGLEYAHHNGVIHRDIKPANIVLTTDGAKLIDLGLAKIISTEEQGATITKTGVLAGTPKYMSPEQCKGMQLNPSSDIYSLASVMFESLTGKSPFTADTDLMVMQMHLNDPPVFPMNCELPSGLSDLIVLAMAKDPSARPQSAQEFTDLLSAIDFSTKALFVPPSNKLTKRLVHTALLLVAIGALCFGGVNFIILQKKETAAVELDLNSPKKPRSEIKKVQVQDTRSSKELLDSVKSSQKVPHYSSDKKQIAETTALANKAILAAKREKSSEQIVWTSLVYDDVAKNEDVDMKNKRLLELEKFTEEHLKEVSQPLKYRVYETLGQNLVQKRNYKAAILNFRKATKYAEENTDEKDKCLRQSYNCYSSLNDFPAMEAIVKELQSSTCSDFSNDLILTEAQLATQYARMKRKAKLDNLLKLIEIHANSASDKRIGDELEYTADNCTTGYKSEKTLCLNLAQMVWGQSRMEQGEFRKKFIEDRRLDQIVKPDQN